MIHDFDEKLAFSQGVRGLSDIMLLKQAIPGCVDVRKTSYSEDVKGVDYIAVLDGGAEIGIDAKAREKGASKFWKYGEAELALELWSVFPTDKYKGKTGWTLSKSTNVDLILYTFAPTDWRKYYLLPYQMLRMAFIRKREDWEVRYSKKMQDSGNWYSQALFVPASVVLQAIAEVMQTEIMTVVGSDRS